MYPVVILIVSQYWDTKLAQSLSARKGEMSFFYFQLISFKWERHEWNGKIPTFLSNDAVITSENRDYLFGRRDSRRETTGSVEQEVMFMLPAEEAQYGLLSPRLYTGAPSSPPRSNGRAQLSG